MTVNDVTPRATPPRIDPRGPRFGAAVTVVFLAAALILGPGLGLIPLVIQAIAFGLGALLGLQFQPWGWIYRTAVRPRLGPPSEWEDPRPPRFAQLVGLIFAVVGIAGSLLGVSWLYYVAVAFTLIAAILNSVFDFCLGCEIYLRFKRLSSRPVVPLRTPERV